MCTDESVSTSYSSVMKELKMLYRSMKKEGHPNFRNEARSIINKKYGAGWREGLKPIESDHHSDEGMPIGVFDMIADDLPDGAYFALGEEWESLFINPLNK